MAVTHSRRPGRFWSRLHFLIRFLGLTGIVAVIVGFALVEPKHWSDFIAPLFPQGTSAQKQIGAWLTAIGGGAVTLMLLGELFALTRFTAGRRSLFGINAFIQVVLATFLLIVVNVFSHGLTVPIPPRVQELLSTEQKELKIEGRHARFDLTREQLFTLPKDLRDRLAQLDSNSKTTVVVYQRHKTFSGLTDKPDRYDYAAERKVVEKVKDLVELLRGIGPKIEVEVLDVEAEGFDDRLAKLTKNRPDLKKAIEAAPENSIFIAATDPADPNRAFVQQMSFNELYQLDRVQSKSDNKERGNLVLLGQGSDGRGVNPFVRRILNIEQRPPRVGILVVHELLTSEGTEDGYTLAGLRKMLTSHGFDVRDVVLKKGWEARTPGLESTADTFEESKLERIEAELESVEEDIKDLEDEVRDQTKDTAALAKLDGEDRDNKLREMVRKYAGLIVTGALTAANQKRVLEFLGSAMEQRKEELDSKRRERQRLVDEKSVMDLDRISESRRLSDVKAKMAYAIADLDMLFIPRLTRMNTGRAILPRLHNVSREQADVIKDFVKSGKPVLAALGPINEPPGTRVGPEFGPAGGDDLEKALEELGFRFSKHTVLFPADARAFAERRSDPLRSDVRVEVPLLDFDKDVRLGYARQASEPKEDSPLRKSLRVTAHSVGDGFDLRLRFPRPIYFEPGTGQKLAYDPTFLLTAAGWNESQPFSTPERRPRFTPPKPDDPDKDSVDARRRGPFPVGAAAEVAVPPSWGGAKGQTARVAVIGQGEAFTGPSLSPAKERLFMQTASWLLGRDDYLPSADHPWQYPRLDITPDHWKHPLWWHATAWAMPLVFAYIGFVVLLYRRLR